MRASHLRESILSLVETSGTETEQNVRPEIRQWVRWS